ncbi:MAG: GntR family transcriptional regulator [Ramlibacter sp.]|nr:GntR family transcriptional regulator [Ramlibacter sp.]
MNTQNIFSRSQQPLFLQVAAIFRRNIQSGAWAPGFRIPTLEELAAQTSVSRITLRQAFGVLEQEGLIRRGRGSGTFVNETIPEVFKLSLPTTWRETVDLSNKLGTISLMNFVDDARLPESLGMKCEFTRGDRYCLMRRLHKLDSTPFCTSEVYIDFATFNRYKKHFVSGTAAPVLEKYYGHRISHAVQSVTIIEAGADAAEALQIPISSPIAELRRFACLEDKVIYFARLEIPSRFVQLEFDLLGK